MSINPRTLKSSRWKKKNPEKHRAQEKARRERKKAEVSALKSKPCMDCGGLFPPECMDFDHVRGEKLFQIGHGHSLTKEKLHAEIEKCDLVCANCHRIRTKRRKNATN